MENESSQLIEVKITGNKYKPGDIRSRDIAEYIASIEEMVAAYLADQHSYIKKDEIIVGLSDIKESSFGLIFKPEDENVYDSFVEISEKLEKKLFHTLPIGTRRPILNLLRLSKKHQSNLEFISLNGKSKLEYTITPETEFFEPPLISGETVLYGEVIRVGGKNDAKVKLSLDTGEEITCDLTLELAKELGGFLYTEVGVIGIARWKSDTLEIESFTITGITNYRSEISLQEGISKLGDLLGKYYEDIDDPVQHINDLRYGAKE